MNKVFVVSLFLGLASISQANFIQCTPGQGDVIVNAAGSSSVFTCAQGVGSTAGASDDNVLGDGFKITAIRLRVSGVFAENNAPTGSSYSVAYSSTNTGVGFTTGSVGCTAVAAENGSNQALGNCISTTAFINVPTTPDAIANFTVTVTGAAGSNPLPFNGSASVFYEVQTMSTSTTPEPATMALMGFSLLGLAAFGRRKV